MGLFVLLLLFLARRTTHVCAALTKGLYPDGNGATTYCTTNTSFKRFSLLWPHYGLGQGPSYALPLTA